MSSRRSRSGGNVHLHHVHAVVEVLAETLPCCTISAEIAIGGADQAEIHVDRSIAAEALEFAFLQHAQKLGLEAECQIADFVEEQSALIGSFEAATPAHQARR